MTGCNPETEFDCGDGKMCIAANRTCDGRNDCGNWEDEPKACGRDDCKTNNGGCHQVNQVHSILSPMCYSLLKLES